MDREPVDTDMEPSPVEIVSVEEEGISNGAAVADKVQPAKKSRKARTKVTAAKKTSNVEAAEDSMEIQHECTLPVQPRLAVRHVKAFMKLDPGVQKISPDAVYLTSKATELFIQMLAKDAWGYTERSRRRTVFPDDIKNAINSLESYAFLEDMI